jgi:hypothetical protein
MPRAANLAATAGSIVLPPKHRLRGAIQSRKWTSAIINSPEFCLTAVRGDATRFNDRSLTSWIECSQGRQPGQVSAVRTAAERDDSL